MLTKKTDCLRFFVDLFCFRMCAYSCVKHLPLNLPDLMFANAEVHQIGPNYYFDMHNVLLCPYTFISSLW